MKLGRLFRIIFSIVVVVCSSLYALSGAAQGALLDLKNPAQSALWGSIGAAGAEVAMEAVYDPVARSKALIKEINQRVAQGELPQMLADVGVELPQEGRAGEAGQRQGVVTRSQSRKQQEIGNVQKGKAGEKALAGGGNLRSAPGFGSPGAAGAAPAPRVAQHSLIASERGKIGEALSREQVIAGLTQVFTKELRADVERTRDLVRAGLSLGALAAGGQAEQMTMMDGTASQALTHNFAPAVIPVGMAALEAALPGLLASAAGALGITYAWDALTDLFSGNPEQQLPFGNEDEKLRSKGKGRAQEVGQSTAAGCMMPEDPDHEPHDEEPKKSKKLRVRNGVEKVELKPEEEIELRKEFKKFDKLQESTKEEIKFYWKKCINFEQDLGARSGKPTDATTLNAAKIERGGGKIGVTKPNGESFDHVTKVKEIQKGLLKIIRPMNKDVKPKPIIKHLNKGRPLSQADQEAFKQMVTKAARLLKRTKEYVPFPDK